MPWRNIEVARISFLMWCRDINKIYKKSRTSTIIHIYIYIVTQHVKAIVIHPTRACEIETYFMLYYLQLMYITCINYYVRKQHEPRACKFRSRVKRALRNHCNMNSVDDNVDVERRYVLPRRRWRVGCEKYKT